MGREIHYNSLTVSCSPLCLYSKLLSINKPDGFGIDMFSVCTFITIRLCNHDLSFPLTPFSCYHHPSYKLLHYSKMPTLTSECHLIQPPSKNYFETIQKTSLPYPNGCTDTLRVRHLGPVTAGTSLPHERLANTASSRAPQNNCWLYPKVKHRTKIQDYYIFGFWVSDLCIENFKLLQQRAVGLPKNWIPFFGTCYNQILQEKLWCDTKHSRKCCVHSSIILYLPLPAKQHLVKERKKQLQNCTSNGLHSYMLRISR